MERLLAAILVPDLVGKRRAHKARHPRTGEALRVMPLALAEVVSWRGNWRPREANISCKQHSRPSTFPDLLAKLVN